MSNSTKAATDNTIVKITQDDLPLACPNPHMTLWSSHPKVFLDVSHQDTVSCPYCGTTYQIDASQPKAH